MTQLNALAREAVHLSLRLSRHTSQVPPENLDGRLTAAEAENVIRLLEER